MARPTKQGIDYFPIDVNFDNKTEMYLIEKEAIGLSVLISIWQIIYSDNGYYVIDDNDLHLLVKKRINVNINDVNECINVAIKRELFDSKLHKKFNILTSKAIQKRYFDAAKRKKLIMYNSKFILNGVNVSENFVNECNNATNVEVEVEV